MKALYTSNVRLRIMFPAEGTQIHYNPDRSGHWWNRTQGKHYFCFLTIFTKFNVLCLHTWKNVQHSRLCDSYKAKKRQIWNITPKRRLKNIQLLPLIAWAQIKNRPQGWEPKKLLLEKAERKTPSAEIVLGLFLGNAAIYNGGKTFLWQQVVK